MFCFAQSRCTLKVSTAYFVWLLVSYQLDYSSCVKMPMLPAWKASCSLWLILLLIGSLMGNSVSWKLCGKWFFGGCWLIRCVTVSPWSMRLSPDKVLSTEFWIKMQLEWLIQIIIQCEIIFIPPPCGRFFPHIKIRCFCVRFPIFLIGKC